MNRIWIVSYFDDGDNEATVTAFDNNKAAYDYFAWANSKHQHASMDECPVYSEFDRGRKKNSSND